MNKSLEQVLEFSKTFKSHIGALNELEPLKSRQLRVKLIFEELKEYAQASDVMGTFNQLCFDSIHSNLQARIEHLDEETVEETVVLLERQQDGDIVDKIEQIDALSDLTYVVDGSKISGGFHEIADSASDLVHSNNMTKAHTDTMHIVETAVKLGVELDPVLSEGLWLAYNKSGKLIKPHDHVKVKLSTLFN